MTERDGTGGNATDEPLRINTMACRWEVDLSRLDPDLAARLRVLWSGADDWEPDRSEPAGLPATLVAAHTDDPARPHCAIALSHDVATAPYDFSSSLTLRSIERQAGRLTMLHGAALALRDNGAGAILVAESGTGKTTAALTLGKHLGYLSDETAVIREDLTLIAHRKPLSIIPASGQPKVEASPAEAGLRPPPPDPWLAAAILLSRTSDHTEPTLEPIAVFDALGEVIPQSSSLPLQDRPLDTLARVLTAGAGCFRLCYREIEDAAHLIVDLLQSVTRGDSAARDWQHEPAPAERRTGPWDASAPSTIDPDVDCALERAPWRDALIDDAGDVFVLNGPKAIRLMALGATIWRLCEKPLPVADIIDGVLAEHGPHPQAADLVATTIDALAAAGLLQPVRAAAPPG